MRTWLGVSIVMAIVSFRWTLNDPGWFQSGSLLVWGLNIGLYVHLVLEDRRVRRRVEAQMRAAGLLH